MTSISDYQIDLKPVFAGPLDLLMHLIRMNEIDIHDIPIGFILEEYLKYLSAMEKLDIDISSEFLVMVATLLEIKSKMLLPSMYLDNMETDEEWYASIADPRRELVRSLIYNDIHRRIEDELRSREEINLRIYAPGRRDVDIDVLHDVSYDLDKISLFDLLTAFQNLLISEKPGKIKINMPKESLEEALEELNFIRAGGKSVMTFTEIIGKRVYPSRLIILFLAILELIRVGMVEVEQDDCYSEIILKWKKK